MSEVLTSEIFLKKGLKFPPAKSAKRLSNYKINRKRLDGTYNKGRKLVIVTPEGKVESDLKVVTTNTFALDTRKQKTLLFKENLRIGCKGLEDSYVKGVLERARLLDTFKKAEETAYALGDGPIMITKQGKTNAFDPNFYYEVVADYDITETQCIVLVQYIEREWVTGSSLDSEVYRLRIIRHYRGYYTEQVFQYTNGVIGRAVDHKLSNARKIPAKGLKVKTGIDDFMVQVLKYKRPINKVYGVSAFEDYKDLVYNIEKRLTLEDAVIDKHSEPTFAVPNNLMEVDAETGEQIFRGVGGIVGIPSGGEKPEYLTWDGKTDAAENLIATLKKELMTQLEYGEVYLKNEFTDASGEALKTLLKGALDKASRIAKQFETTLKIVVQILLQLEGHSVSIEDINVEWQDGITETLETKANVIKIRKESGTMSTKRALMVYDGLSEEQAEKEIEQINKENNIDAIRGSEIDERIDRKVDEIFSTGE